MLSQHLGCLLFSFTSTSSPSLPCVGGLLPTCTTGDSIDVAGQCASHAGLFALGLKGHTMRNSIPQSQRPPFTYSVHIHGPWPPQRTAQIWNICTTAEGATGLVGSLSVSPGFCYAGWALSSRSTQPSRDRPSAGAPSKT